MILLKQLRERWAHLSLLFLLMSSSLLMTASPAPAYGRSCVEAIEALYQAEPKQSQGGVKRKPFGTFTHQFMSQLLGLRYRRHVTGSEEIASRGTKGIFFLPNHQGWGIDPFLMWLSVFKPYKARFVIAEGQANSAGMKWMLEKINAVIIPEPMGANDFPKVQRVKEVLAEIAAGLERGENYLMYPTGRISRDGFEMVGGNSGVQRVLSQAPNARVVLVKMDGLWGSSFTFGANGQYPDGMLAIKNGAIAVLKNLVFFTPRRDIDIAFSEPTDFPRGADKATINRYLESFYNDTKPLSLDVPLLFWSFRGTVVRPEAELKVSDSRDHLLTRSFEQEVETLLRELFKIDQKLSLDTHLKKDLGLDSLDYVELLAVIEKTYAVKIPDAAVPNIHTIRDLLFTIVEYNTH